MSIRKPSASPRARHPRARLAAIAALPLGLFLSGCSDVTPRGTQVDTLTSGLVVARNPAPHAEPVRGEETLRLGALDGGPSEFGRIAGLALDPTGTELLVLDAQSAEVRVFDRDGEHLRTFGREGAGPGELRSPTGLLFGSDGSLWVIDLGNARYTQYTLDGRPAGTLLRQVRGRLDECCVFDDAGRLLDAGVGIGADRITYRAVFRVDSAGAQIDTFPIPQMPLDEAFFDPSAQLLVRIPYTPRHVWTFAPDGDLWLAYGGEYRLTRWTMEGDSVRVVTMAGDPPAVTAVERRRVEQRLDSLTEGTLRARYDRIPDRKPFIQDLHTDDGGRLWVRRHSEEGSLYDVFDAGGVFLGAVELAADLARPILIRGDEIYGAGTDARGVPRVVRYRVAGLGGAGGPVP